MFSLVQPPGRSSSPRRSRIRGPHGPVTIGNAAGPTYPTAPRANLGLQPLDAPELGASSSPTCAGRHVRADHGCTKHTVSACSPAPNGTLHGPPTSRTQKTPTPLRIDQQLPHAVAPAPCVWITLPPELSLPHRLPVTVNWISKNAPSGSQQRRRRWPLRSKGLGRLRTRDSRAALSRTQRRRAHRSPSGGLNRREVRRIATSGGGHEPLQVGDFYAAFNRGSTLRPAGNAAMQVRSATSIGHGSR